MATLFRPLYCCANRLRRNFIIGNNSQARSSLADSITTWRLAGSAVSKSGQLGSFEQGIRVFQDFFIDIDFPAELTQNDEVTVLIAVFNYLDEAQTIKLQASQEDWFEFVNDRADKTISALPGSAMKASYRIRVLKPGRHALTVTAIGSKLSDAVSEQSESFRTELESSRL